MSDDLLKLFGGQRMKKVYTFLIVNTGFPNQAFSSAADQHLSVKLPEKDIAFSTFFIAYTVFKASTRHIG